MSTALSRFALAGAVTFLASCSTPTNSVSWNVPPDSPHAVTPPDEPYVGQSAPGLTPERFAPGIVSTEAIELNGVFSPDGR